jgi:molybdate transport system ATP-binding protein
MVSFGRTVSRYHVPAHQRAVGYVFQDANLFALTVATLRLKRIPQRGSRIAQEGGGLLGIGHLLDRLPDRCPARAQRAASPAPC